MSSWKPHAVRLWPAVLLTICFFPPAWAEEIRGKVSAVEGRRVKIEYQTESLPREGDPVRIGFEMAGDLIAAEGDWKIVEVTDDFAWAQAEDGDAGTIAVDYMAIIESENPVKKADQGRRGQTEETQLPERGYLGIQIQGLTPEIKDRLKIPVHTNGVLVREVPDASPASAAGIRKGDVIVELDGRGFPNLNAFPSMVAALAPGTRVGLKLIREGRVRSLEVILGEMPKAHQYWLKGRESLQTPDSANYQAAFQWFVKAAALGYPMAAADLGRLYEEGLGVPSNVKEAINWYRLAAQKGHPDAQRRLKELGESW